MACIPSMCWDCYECFPSRKQLSKHECDELSPDENAFSRRGNRKEDFPLKTCFYCDEEFYYENAYHGHMPRCEGRPGYTPPRQPTYSAPPSYVPPAQPAYAPLSQPAYTPPQQAPQVLPPAASLNNTSAITAASNMQTVLDKAETLMRELEKVYTAKVDSVSAEIDMGVADHKSRLKAEYDAKFRALEKRASDAEAALNEQRAHAVEIDNKHDRAVLQLKAEYDTKLEEQSTCKIAPLQSAVDDLERRLSSLRAEHVQELVKIEARHEAAMSEARAVHNEELDLMNDEMNRLEAEIAKLQSGSTTHVAPTEMSRQPSSKANAPCRPPHLSYRSDLASDNNDEVTVYLDAKSTSFRVERLHLSEVSSVFASLLKSTRQTMFGELEKPETAIKVFDFPSTTFKIFHDWLMDRALPARYWPRAEILQDEAIVAQAREELVTLYSFAHTYDIPQLRRDALDAFMTDCIDRKICPSPSEIDMMYAALPRDSPMINLMLDLYAYSWDGEQDARQQEEWAQLPAEFFQDLALRCVKSRPVPTHTYELCTYHEHD